MGEPNEKQELDVGRSFASMVEKVRDYAIFLLDRDGIIRTWNPAAAVMKGYAAHEAIGSHLRMLYTEEDQARGHAEHNLKIAAQSGTFQEETWRRKKDGTRFWALVEIIAIRTENDGLDGFCKITRDITVRKALNDLLARERERAQVTLAAISDAVISFDQQGRVDFINRKAEELTGWRAGEAKGERLPDVVKLQSPAQGDQPGVSPGHESPGIPAAALLVSKTGVRHEVEHASAEIQLRDGRGAGGVVVVRDISHVRTVEKQLKHADRRKDEFLAMLAHELRNPLAPISAATDLLGMGRLEPAAVKRTSEVIARQVRHMTGLINDLLDVSRVTRGLVELERARLDLKEVVADALEQVRPMIDSRSHHLTVDLAPGDAFVEGDHKRLVQVITNLLGNAAKYTRAGGHVVLSMAMRDAEIVLYVKDDGVGMSAEFVQRAFEMFAQAERTPDRAQGGLGLGLALVRSLVELHGGQVTAESEGPGRGSTFTVVLPRAASPVVGTVPVFEKPGEAGPKGLRILVVDDNVDAAQLLAMYLQAVGHQVAVDHRGRDAMDTAQRFAPHVCLLDIGLPDLDGFELARRLRLVLPDATLVAITGYGQPQDVKNAADAGYDRHFVKPVDREELVALLNGVAARVTAPS